MFSVRKYASTQQQVPTPSQSTQLVLNKIKVWFLSVLHDFWGELQEITHFYSRYRFSINYKNGTWFFVLYSIVYSIIGCSLKSFCVLLLFFDVFRCFSMCLYFYFVYSKMFSTRLFFTKFMFSMSVTWQT